MAGVCGRQRRMVHATENAVDAEVWGRIDLEVEVRSPPGYGITEQRIEIYGH